MTHNPITEIKDYTDLNFNELTRDLDRVKSDLFTRSYAAFYAPLQASMNFLWTLDCPTACTDGVNICWNPKFFLRIPRASRLTVFMHEIQHAAGLHFHRMGDRIPHVWNFATDVKINNRLKRQGYSFEGIENCWIDLNFAEEAVEEDIYEALIQNATQFPSFGSWGDDLTGSEAEGDMMPEGIQGDMTKEEQAAAVNNVIRAVEQAKLSKGAGNLPGGIEATLNQFLTPVVPWEQYLYRFFTELEEGGYSWRKPNRRHTSIYLPSRFEEEGALGHLAYFEDCSGSISDADLIRFNSEFKYCHTQFKPKKMTLIQFDDEIQQVLEFTDEDEMEHIKVKGRGGTDLRPVRDWIEEHKPTAAVIFTDLYCAPMERLTFDIPILWVVVSNSGATVPMGTLIHIR